MKSRPVIVSPANPVGLDAKINFWQNIFANAQFINTEGATEGWFDDGLLLGLAFKDEATQRPILYWQGREYYPLQPDDNFRIKAFFYLEDPSPALGLTDVSYTLNFVVWLNQNLYSQTAEFKIREWLILEIQNLIQPNVRQEDFSTLNVFRSEDEIFSNYTLEEKTFFKFPYQGFRVQFTDFLPLECRELLNLSIGGSFSPDDLPDLELWLEAREENLNFNGANEIDTFDGLSSENWIFTQILPPFKAIWNAESEEIDTFANVMSNDINTFSTNGAGEVYLVVRIDSGVIFANVLSQGDDISVDRDALQFGFQIDGGGPRMSVRRLTGATPSAVGQTLLTYGEYYILNFSRVDATTFNMYINGVPEPYDDNSFGAQWFFPTGTIAHIFAFQNRFNNLQNATNGAFRAALVYGSSHSDVDRLNVVNYLTEQFL